jgi:hypothetical protein
MTDHESILFKHKGEKLKGKIISLAVGIPGSPTGTTGIVTERTHITFVNAQGSAIAIIPNTKQLVLFSLDILANLTCLSQGSLIGIPFPKFYSRRSRHRRP